MGKQVVLVAKKSWISREGVWLSFRSFQIHDLFTSDFHHSLSSSMGDHDKNIAIRSYSAAGWMKEISRVASLYVKQTLELLVCSFFEWFTVQEIPWLDFKHSLQKGDATVIMKPSILPLHLVETLWTKLTVTSWQVTDTSIGGSDIQHWESFVEELDFCFQEIAFLHLNSLCHIRKMPGWTNQ